MTESLDDLNSQIDFLHVEKSKLGFELAKAIVRDTPEKVEAEAVEFNKLLKDALSTVEVLRGIYNGLKAHTGLRSPCRMNLTGIFSVPLWDIKEH